MRRRPMPTPREAAVHFEATKIKMLQTKEGMIFSLAIHPDDIPDELVRAFVGSRWMCALVRLGDDEKPVASPAQIEAERAVQSAAMLCRDATFQAWLVGKGLVDIASEIAAADAVREFCQVDSRAELKTNTNARARLARLKEMFDARHR